MSNTRTTIAIGTIAPPVGVAKGHIPELDGLRALSVIFVMLIHVSYGRIGGGFLGVDVFFVLSGYLITGLLAREQRISGRIDLAAFYMRRVLRILPPLVVAIVLAMALWPVPTASLTDRAHAIIATLLFDSNAMGPEVMRTLVHTWSLAIEEQFYLFWPALFLWVRSPPRLTMIAIGVIVSGLALRVAIVTAGGDPHVIYTFTLTRIDSIAVGALLALAEPALDRWFRPTPRVAAAGSWVALAMVSAAFLFVTLPGIEAFPPGFTVFALVVAALIFLCQRTPRGDPVSRLLRAPSLRYIGRRSYGLYLLHYPIFDALEAFRINGDIVNFAIVAFAKVCLSMILTELCWHIVERPILRLKVRYAVPFEVTSPTNER